jgi:uncharacterized protein YfaP (DUF2135 family)
MVIPLPDRAEAATVRATMSWSNATDIDLHVWDVNGRHSSCRNLTAIPASVVSQDILVGSEWKPSLKVTTLGDRFGTRPE